MAARHRGALWRTSLRNRAVDGRARSASSGDGAARVRPDGRTRLRVSARPAPGRPCVRPPAFTPPFENRSLRGSPSFASGGDASARQRSARTLGACKRRRGRVRPRPSGPPRNPASGDANGELKPMSESLHAESARTHAATANASLLRLSFGETAASSTRTEARDVNRSSWSLHQIPNGRPQRSMVHWARRVSTPGQRGFLFSKETPCVLSSEAFD
jgi:hypothetical protein